MTSLSVLPSKRARVRAQELSVLRAPSTCHQAHGGRCSRCLCGSHICIRGPAALLSWASSRRQHDMQARAAFMQDSQMAPSSCFVGAASTSCCAIESARLQAPLITDACRCRHHWRGWCGSAVTAPAKWAPVLSWLLSRAPHTCSLQLLRAWLGPLAASLAQPPAGTASSQTERCWAARLCASLAHAAARHEPGPLAKLHPEWQVSRGCSLRQSEQTHGSRQVVQGPACLWQG